MGPRSVERGKRHPIRRALVPDFASMGPRSVERGKMLTTIGTPGMLWVLQWGRVLLNAESWITSMEAEQRSGRFNGAAFC